MHSNQNDLSTEIPQSHWIVDTPDIPEQVRLHFENIPTPLAETSLEQTCGATILELGKHYETINPPVPKLFRKMCVEEVNSVLKNSGLPPPILGKNGKKYLAEDLDKVLEFNNKAVVSTTEQKICRFKMKPDKYQDMRNELIPQKGCKGLIKNEYHYEGIMEGDINYNKWISEDVPKDVPRNWGVHKDKITEFNDAIIDIKVLDPNDTWVKNKTLRYISQNKMKIGLIGISIAIEAHDIYISVMNAPDQKAVKIASKSLSIGMSQLGSYIGEIVGAAFGGIGVVIGSILGSIAFSLLADGLSELMFMCFPPHDKSRNYSEIMKEAEKQFESLKGWHLKLWGDIEHEKEFYLYGEIEHEKKFILDEEIEHEKEFYLHGEIEHEKKFILDEEIEHEKKFFGI